MKTIVRGGKLKPDAGDMFSATEICAFIDRYCVPREYKPADILYMGDGTTQ